MGGKVVHILINDLRNDVYYARIVVDVKGTQVEIDSRPSDAIALAVRVKTPVFVADVVMDKAAIEPDEDVEKSLEEDTVGGDSEVEPGRLSAFADFVDSLDLDDLEDSDD
jgi:uncharacterized protein